MAGELDKRIADRAYEIWESEGRPEGRSHEHWEQARSEFAEAKSEAGQRGGARKTASAKPPAKTASGKSAAAKPARKGSGAAKPAAKAGQAAAKPKAGPRSGKA